MDTATSDDVEQIYNDAVAKATQAYHQEIAENNRIYEEGQAHAEIAYQTALDSIYSEHAHATRICRDVVAKIEDFYQKSHEDAIAEILTSHQDALNRIASTLARATGEAYGRYIDDSNQATSTYDASLANAEASNETARDKAAQDHAKARRIREMAVEDFEASRQRLRDDALAEIGTARQDTLDRITNYNSKASAEAYERYLQAYNQAQEASSQAPETYNLWTGSGPMTTAAGCQLPPS
jgi:hypothetical protein